MAKKLRIVSKVDGFRRGGVGHPAKETFHDLDAFTKEEREAIENEPNLIVDEVDVKEDTKGNAAGGGAAKK